MLGIYGPPGSDGPSAAGKPVAEPPACECGVFATGQCKLCGSAYCGTHAELVENRFICYHCSDPAVLEFARTHEEQVRAQQLADINAHAAEAQERARRLAARLPMTHEQLVAFVRGEGDEDQEHTHVRDVTAAELAKIMAASGREQSAVFERGLLRRRFVAIGWTVARHEHSRDRDSQVTDAYNILVTPEGRLVRVSHGPYTGRPSVSDSLPPSTVCPKEWLSSLAAGRYAAVKSPGMV